MKLSVEKFVLNATQLPYLAEGILILASMTLGFLLRRAGKPYGKVKLIIHLFFVLWFTIGFGFVLYGHINMSGTKATRVPVAVMGLMVLTQFVTGILMLASKRSGKTLPRIYLLSAMLLLLFDISALIITGNSAS